MVIVCLGADASGSGFDQIKYKASPQVTSFVSNFTRQFTTDQILILDTFVDRLKSAGIWENIQQLYLPMLSYIPGSVPALRQSFIDMKQSWDSGVLVKNSYATDGKLGDHYTMANRGIERTTTVANYSDITKMFRVQNDLTLSSKNSHFLLFKMQGTYDFSNVDKRQYFGFAYDAVKKNPLFEQFTATQARIGTAVIASNSSVSLNSNSANVLIGYSSKSGSLIKKGDSSLVFNVASETEYTLNNPMYFGPMHTNISIGMVSIGLGLDANQMQIFDEEIQSLNVALA